MSKFVVEKNAKSDISIMNQFPCAVFIIFLIHELAGCSNLKDVYLFSLTMYPQVLK